MTTTSDKERHGHPSLSHTLVSFEDFKSSFKNSIEIQAELSNEIIEFNKANHITKQQIAQDAMRDRKFLEHCGKVALHTMNKYEDEIDKLTEENTYLREENKEYIKQHGKLNETILKRIRDDHQPIAIDAKERGNRMKIRLLESNRQIIEQGKALK